MFNNFTQISPFANRVVDGISLAQLFTQYAGRNQWAAENSTIVSTTTTWIDYAGVHNIANPAAGNQPTRVDPDSDFNNKKTDSFGGVDDYLIKNTSNYGAGQTTGSLWAIVKTGANFAGSPVIFSANNTANTIEKAFVYFDTLGKLNIIFHNGIISNILTTVNAFSINSKYLIEFESNGSTTSCYTNGVAQTLVGTNNGSWFSYANTGNTLDNIVIGGAIRSASPVYYLGKIALVGNYPLLTAGNRSDLEAKFNTFYNVY